MSIDKSLKRRSALARNRSVMTRTERIKALIEEGRFKEGSSPFGLPKTKVVKIVLKKAKKEAKEDDASSKGKAGAKGGKK